MSHLNSVTIIGFVGADPAKCKCPIVNSLFACDKMAYRRLGDVEHGGDGQGGRGDGARAAWHGAHLPLDGGESGGKFRWGSIVQSWMTERPGILWKSRRFSVATS